MTAQPEYAGQDDERPVGLAPDVAKDSRFERLCDELFAAGASPEVLRDARAGWAAATRLGDPQRARAGARVLLCSRILARLDVTDLVREVAVEELRATASLLLSATPAWRK